MNLFPLIRWLTVEGGGRSVKHRVHLVSRHSIFTNDSEWYGMIAMLVSSYLSSVIVFRHPSDRNIVVIVVVIVVVVVIIVVIVLA